MTLANENEENQGEHICILETFAGVQRESDGMKQGDLLIKKILNQLKLV